jgi:hypothetical protein
MTNINSYDRLLAELRPTLERLEVMRKKALVRIVACSVCFTGLWSAFCYSILAVWFIDFIEEFYQLLLWPIIFVWAGCYLYFTHDLRTQFKNKVIRSFITLLDPSFEYDPSRHIDEADFKHSGIFRKYTRFRGDDYVEGRIGGNRLRFSELYVKYEPKEFEYDNKKDNIFHGLFVIVNIPKSFQSTTYVLPKTKFFNKDIFCLIADELKGKLKQPTHDYGELIKLEEPEFNNYFVVYSSNLIETRSLLSTRLMQRMTTLRQRAKVNVSFSFVDAQMYVAVHYGRDLFEPSLWTNYLKYDLLDSYLDNLQLIIDIMEELNQDLRIWNHPHRDAG